MPMFVLNAKIENPQVIKGIKRKWGQVKKTAMQATARFWLDEIFPGHFTPGNESRYQHEKRNAFYKSVVKRIEGEGQGKYVDLTLRGKSKRWLRSSARITATQNKATLYMTGPTYFANPKTGRVQKEIEQNGKKRTITINITRQPDKVRELTQQNNQDRAKLQKFLESDLHLRVNLAVRSN